MQSAELIGESFPLNGGSIYLGIWAHGRNCGKSKMDDHHFINMAHIPHSKVGGLPAQVTQPQTLNTHCKLGQLEGE